MNLTGNEIVRISAVDFKKMHDDYDRSSSIQPDDLRSVIFRDVDIAALLVPKAVGIVLRLVQNTPKFLTIFGVTNATQSLVASSVDSTGNILGNATSPASGCPTKNCILPSNLFSNLDNVKNIIESDIQKIGVLVGAVNVNQIYFSKSVLKIILGQLCDGIKVSIVLNDKCVQVLVMCGVTGSDATEQTDGDRLIAYSDIVV